jgi:single-strand DNA-binding protein
MATTTIVGRVSFVDSKVTPTGMTVTTLSIAENYSKKVNGQWVDATDFFRVTCFGKMADNANAHYPVGSIAKAEATIRNESYEKDGKKVYVTKYLCSDLKRLANAPNKSSQSNSQQSQQSGQEQDYNVSHDATFANDDIPF